MKRYRTLPGTWDGRALVLAAGDFKGEPGSKAAELHCKAVASIKEELIETYGMANAVEKLKNFTDAGYLNISIVTEHNYLLLSIRDAYVATYYYPALVAACALGERILNDLILKMRAHFKHQDRRVHTKEAFTNWELMVRVLRDWDVISAAAETLFLELKELRTYSIHYDSKLHQDLKDRSFRALRAIGELIHSIFAADVPEKYRIPNTVGAFYIKKEAESHPFIREYFLPHCIRVGPNHRLTDLSVYPPTFIDDDYGTSEITDEEFARRVTR